MVNHGVYSKYRLVRGKINEGGRKMKRLRACFSFSFHGSSLRSLRANPRKKPRNQELKFTPGKLYTAQGYNGEVSIRSDLLRNAITDISRSKEQKGNSPCRRRQLYPILIEDILAANGTVGLTLSAGDLYEHRFEKRNQRGSGSEGERFGSRCV